jgi:nitrile hydratase
VTERFAADTRVRVRLADPLGHTRAPRYARGHTGVVVAASGRQPLPDAVVAGTDPQQVREPVYAVRFDSAELWGVGGHSVTIELWESYLEPADD